MAKIKKDDFIAGLKEMTILEIKELVDAMKDEFGIDPTAVAVAGPAGGGAGGDAAPTEVDVILASAGAQKIKVIKVVREITGLGLKEAKAICDEAPKPLKEKVKVEAAEEMKAKLEAEGATVELK